MIIKQLEIGDMDNFCYILGCETTRKALVIDPGADVARIVTEAEKEGLAIELIVNTHAHGDHTAGNTPLKALTGATIVLHERDAAGYPRADVRLSDEKTLQLGDITIDVIQTPGHTPGGICLYAQGNLFTGDTLFVGDSGRTDFQNGNSDELYHSITEVLFPLGDHMTVWPGHDYGPTPSSTIGWEKRHNVNAREYGYYVGD
jgi:glyoxylase-like metal-dependent hydrolase (beta-lactamase superfamily II)